VIGRRCPAGAAHVAWEAASSQVAASIQWCRCGRHTCVLPLKRTWCSPVGRKCISKITLYIQAGGHQAALRILALVLGDIAAAEAYCREHLGPAGYRQLLGMLLAPGPGAPPMLPEACHLLAAAGGMVCLHVAVGLLQLQKRALMRFHRLQLSAGLHKPCMCGGTLSAPAIQNKTLSLNARHSASVSLIAGCSHQLHNLPVADLFFHFSGEHVDLLQVLEVASPDACPADAQSTLISSSILHPQKAC